MLSYERKTRAKIQYYARSKKNDGWKLPRASFKLKIHINIHRTWIKLILDEICRYLGTGNFRIHVNTSPDRRSCYILNPICASLKYFVGFVSVGYCWQSKVFLSRRRNPQCRYYFTTRKRIICTSSPDRAAKLLFPHFYRRTKLTAKTKGITCNSVSSNRLFILIAKEYVTTPNKNLKKADVHRAVKNNSNLIFFFPSSCFFFFMCFVHFGFAAGLNSLTDIKSSCWRKFWSPECLFVLSYRLSSLVLHPLFTERHNTFEMRQFPFLYSYLCVPFSTDSSTIQLFGDGVLLAVLSHSFIHLDTWTGLVMDVFQFPSRLFQSLFNGAVWFLNG